MASSCPTHETTTELHPKLLAPVSPSGDPLTSSTIRSPTYTIAIDGAVQPHLGLKLEAHRRWNASLPLGFLWSVERVEINMTRTDADKELVFELEVFLSLPTSRLPISKPSSNEECATCPAFKLERRFCDFEELRRSVSSCVSMERQCSCQYCLELIEYIRFSWTQPRRLVKLFGSQEKHKEVLQSFINNFVAMGQRRVQKPRASKRKCEAQHLVPQVLSAFLLNDAIY